MKIFHGTENANIATPCVLTLGVFDGLHLGHQQIVRTVVDRAKQIGAVPTAITFDPHPRAVLHPESAPPLLQTLDQRLSYLEFLGIEQAIVINFSRDFASQSAEEFIRETIHDRLRAKEIYLGQGFAFGKGRSGNIELLKKLSDELGFHADEVAEVKLRGQRISSSRIREELPAESTSLAECSGVRTVSRALSFAATDAGIRSDSLRRIFRLTTAPSQGTAFMRRPPSSTVFGAEALRISACVRLSAARMSRPWKPLCSTSMAIFTARHFASDSCTASAMSVSLAE